MPSQTAPAAFLFPSFRNLRGVIHSPVARGGGAVPICQTFQSLAKCFLNHVCARATFLLVQWHDAASCSRASGAPPPAVGNWLLLSSAALVIAIILVGGVTRLTEWRPITGILPPLSRAESSSPHYPVRLSPSACFLTCVDLDLCPGAFVTGPDAGLV